jgi:hypothetical protein
VTTAREVIYVEEKGHGCGSAAHRRNQPVKADRERFARVELERHAS